MDGVRSVALTLPLEMQHEIALQCDRSDLAHLARVHSAWTTACEAVLYENVSTAISWFDPCTVELLQTLATRPNKIKRVRSFSVTFPLGVSDSDFNFDTLPSLPSLYCDVLSQMNNLATLRIPSIGGLENIKFFEAVLEIIQAGNFKLKSFVLPEKLAEHLLSTLDKALAAHTDTFRCLGLSFDSDDHRPTFVSARWDRLAHFATRYSVFATSGSSDIHLYPVFDASSPMWNSELYVQDIQRATYTRGDLKGPHLTVTFIRQCYSVVPRLLRYLATSFPVIKAFTFSLLYEAPLNYASDANVFPALEAIIGALAAFECQVTTLAFTVRCDDLDLELTWEEQTKLLRLIGSRCNSVQEVTLPDATQYRRDPNDEDGWSREYIADAETDWDRDNWFHDDSDDTDSDPYEGFEFYGSD